MGAAENKSNSACVCVKRFIHVKELPAVEIILVAVQQGNNQLSPPEKVEDKTKAYQHLQSTNVWQYRAANPWKFQEREAKKPNGFYKMHAQTKDSRDFVASTPFF